MSTVQKQTALSITMAGISCFLPYLFPPGEWDSIIRISLMLALAWFGHLAVCLFRYRKEGLWLLIGMPFALYWPFVMIAMSWACSHDVRNCP
jgi:hypothetical protein